MKRLAAALAIAALIAGAAWLFWPRKAPPTQAALEAARAKAQTATSIAQTVEAHTIETRPAVQEAKTKAKAATEKRRKTYGMLQGETPAPPAGPLIDQTATTPAAPKIVDTPTHAQSGADHTPTASLIAEILALQNYIAALEAQNTAEEQRGDAWKEAAQAQTDHAQALQDTLDAAASTAHRRGLKIGIAIGAAAAILIFVLI